MKQAVLKGYSRRGLKDASYPCIIKQEGESVEGVLIENLSSDHLNLLDRFEGDEYERIDVTVRTDLGEIKTQTYYWMDKLNRVSAHKWDSEWLKDENAVFEWLRSEDI